MHIFLFNFSTKYGLHLVQGVCMRFIIKTSYTVLIHDDFFIAIRKFLYRKEHATILLSNFRTPSSLKGIHIFRFDGGIHRSYIVPY
ncbi:MAG: hypothetical protein H6Q70_1537 [Firmicutes bacterium]|nr:hypothetical protein [Bacillota bacterium]